MIRDLQHHLNADGRDYVIEVCAPGRNPAPVSAGPFDVHIGVDVAEIIREWRAAEPEHVVRMVVDYVKLLVPKSVTRDQWTKFADGVLAWVCAHQAAKQ
jgi:hypothetical protein